MARSAVWAIAVVGLVLLAGCSGGPGGSEKPPLEASAEPAGLSESAVEALGLTEANASTDRLNTTIFVSIQGDVELSTSREVHATTHRVTYRSSSASPPVVVVVYAVPAVTLLKDTAPTVRNPAGEQSPATLAGAAQSVYAIESLSATDDGQATFLGNQTTVRALSGAGGVGGTSTDLAGYMVTGRHDADYVTVVVLAPDGTALPQRAQVLGAIAHPKK